MLPIIYYNIRRVPENTQHRKLSFCSAIEAASSAGVEPQSMEMMM